jgi:hypothetical protein
VFAVVFAVVGDELRLDPDVVELVASRTAAATATATIAASRVAELCVLEVSCHCFLWRRKSWWW